MNVVVNDLKSIIMNCLLVDNCFIYNIIIKILIFLNIRICFEMCSMEYMILWVVFIFLMDVFVLIDLDGYIGFFI